MSRFFLSLCLILSIPAHAIGMKMKMTQKDTETVRTYERSDTALAYTQTSEANNIRMTLSGSGLMSLMRKKRESENIKVPGVDIQGHSQVSLTRDESSQRIFLNVDFLIDDKVQDIAVHAQTQFSAEAVFTQGNWEDYLAGHDVQLELTPEGQDLANELTSVRAKASMEATQQKVAENLERQGGHLENVEFEKTISKGVSTISGNLNKLEIKYAPTQFRMVMSVKVPLKKRRK